MRGTALALLTENAPDDERVYFARGRVLRHLAYLRPLGRCEIPIKSVEHHVEHLALVRGELFCGTFAPEVRLGKYRGKLLLGGRYGAGVTAEEPLHPPCRVQCSALCAFEFAVVRVLLYFVIFASNPLCSKRITLCRFWLPFHMGYVRACS